MEEGEVEEEVTSSLKRSDFMLQPEIICDRSWGGVTSSPVRHEEEKSSQSVTVDSLLVPGQEDTVETGRGLW